MEISIYPFNFSFNVKKQGLTEATKNGSACQNGVKASDAAKICSIAGSPIEWPILSRTTIAANRVALDLSDIQKETSDRAATRLPKPAAKTNTPGHIVSGTKAPNEPGMITCQLEVGTLTVKDQ